MVTRSRNIDPLWNDLIDNYGVVLVNNEPDLEVGVAKAVKQGWRRITPEWLARMHRNGSGTSWMHLCANKGHGVLAKKTDSGRVRCKECGRYLDEAPLMLMELQRLKGSV